MFKKLKQMCCQDDSVEEIIFSTNIQRQLKNELGDAGEMDLSLSAMA